MTKIDVARESRRAVLRKAQEAADVEEDELYEIQNHLELGQDGDALSGMREFFRRHRKPIHREKRYDRESASCKGERVGA
jgi:hypothetical protein